MSTIRAMGKGRKAQLALALLVTFAAQPASGEKVLYSFQAGNDGRLPYGPLLADGAGNLYGTTAAGGGGLGCVPGAGCGTVFKLAADGSESVLHAFQGGTDGAEPFAGVIADPLGNFYGTTAAGGSADAGTVFEIAPDGTETVLYAFAGGSDGIGPGELLRDTSGNLYGTTALGGDVVRCGGTGCGTVFELTADGTKNTLYAFLGGGRDGAHPHGVMVRDASGNLFGTTEAGGTCSEARSGCGTIFKLAPDGTESAVYAFQAGNDGRQPESGLVEDGQGNMYGTTAFGGGANGNCCGTVFKLASDGTESVLHAFQGGVDGAVPQAGLVRDRFGNLFGTTYFGGGTGCKQNLNVGCGTVFKLAADGTETVLYIFKAAHNGAHGINPAAPLLLKNDFLYGTAAAGAYKNGIVFSVKK